MQRYNAAAVTQSVGVFALHMEGWVFLSQSRQTLEVKTYSDSFGNRTDVSVTGPR